MISPSSSSYSCHNISIKLKLMGKYVFWLGNGGVRKNKATLNEAEGIKQSRKLHCVFCSFMTFFSAHK